MTSEVEGMLRRYLAIQREERALKAEKEGLRDRIVDYLGCSNVTWEAALGGRNIEIRVRVREDLEWNDVLLRSRLGSRYESILYPDIKKIREHMDEVAPLLRPALLSVGTPTRKSVWSAVSDGVVSRDEVAGVHTTRQRPILTVRHLPAGRVEQSAVA